MDLFGIIFVVLGLALFEIITSVDNAIINADILRTVKKDYRKWFLFWGIWGDCVFVLGALQGPQI